MRSIDTKTYWELYMETSNAAWDAVTSTGCPGASYTLAERATGLMDAVLYVKMEDIVYNLNWVR